MYRLDIKLKFGDDFNFNEDRIYSKEIEVPFVPSADIVFTVDGLDINTEDAIEWNHKNKNFVMWGIVDTDLSTCPFDTVKEVESHIKASGWELEE
jgi:hypothetical protein